MKITNPDKIIYLGSNLTKQNIIDYYIRVYPYLKPFMQGRNIVLRRFSNGIESKDFYQRTSPSHFPKALSHEGGIKSTSLEDLIYLVNLSSIEQYANLNKIISLNPDKMVIDLDPPASKPELCVNVAKEFKVVLDSLGLASYPMTTGSKGIHIVIPIKPNLEFKEVRAICKQVCKLVHDKSPDLTTMNPRMEGRSDKVYLDYTRNSQGQVVILPYSLRANKEAKVAIPFSWVELKPSILTTWTYFNIDRRLKLDPFPWKNYKINDLSKLKLDPMDKTYTFLDNRVTLKYPSVLTKSANQLNTPFDKGFLPTYTPIEMLRMGVFGGSYFNNPKLIGDTPRVIFSLDKTQWGMPDPSAGINKYKVLVAVDPSFSQWKEDVHKDDPLGWFQWYVKYYYGRRHADDQRQIRRWRHTVIKYSLQSYGRPQMLTQRQALLQWAWNSDLDAREILDSYKKH